MVQRRGERRAPGRFDLVLDQAETDRRSIGELCAIASASLSSASSSTTFQIDHQFSAISALSGSPSSASARARATPMERCRNSEVPASSAAPSRTKLSTNFAERAAMTISPASAMPTPGARGRPVDGNHDRHRRRPQLFDQRADLIAQQRFHFRTGLEGVAADQLRAGRSRWPAPVSTMARTVLSASAASSAASTHPAASRRAHCIARDCSARG